MIKPKPPEWEIRDLHDGRFAILKKGLVVFVGRSAEECKEWHTKRAGDPWNSISLNEAIGRLR